MVCYIAGKPIAFTSKDHIFRAGESVEKQLILINDSRQAVNFECDWTLDLPQPIKGESHTAVEVGKQARLPLRFNLPATLPAGEYELHARARFGDGQGQSDSFTLTVLPGVAGWNINSNWLNAELFDSSAGTHVSTVEQWVNFGTNSPPSIETWLSASDLMYVPRRGLIYASLPGPIKLGTNLIVSLHPTRGTIIPVAVMPTRPISSTARSSAAVREPPL